MRAGIFGSLGSAFAALCCAGVPAVLGALSAVGIGFLVNDLILFPLLAISLGLALWGLGGGVSRHGFQSVLVLGWIGAGLMVASIFSLPALIYAGAMVMVAVSIWNTLSIRHMRCAR